MDGYRQPIVDSLRMGTPEIWPKLDWKEKSRFFRHLRSLWQVVGHRMPPEVSQKIAALMAAGKLRTMAGRVTGIREESGSVQVSFRARGGLNDNLLSTDYLINCAGPAQEWVRGSSPLVDSLVEAGVAVPDPTGLGLSVNAEGAVMGRDGRASSAAFAMGILRRGYSWESTAVPELRVQAKRLADHLLSSS